MGLYVDNLSVQIKQTKLVKEASLKVSDQQCVGIIGPNGCGKSTLVKGITGVLAIASGQIELDGLDTRTADAKEVARNMSVVGQFNEVNFDLTVEEMVLLGRTPYKKLLEGDKASDYQLVTKALEKMELLAYRHRNFLSLSGGEKQRVIVARALCQETPYMVLDEPTNHLDIKHQLRLMKELKSLNIGILTVLHDLETAARYCDYIYAMKEGVIIAEGRPEEMMTSELLTRLYDVKCEVYRNPFDQGLNFYFKEEEN